MASSVSWWSWPHRTQRLGRSDERGRNVAGQQHWGWGVGIHRCLAVPLARAVLATLIAEWLRRVPDFELEPGFTPSESEHQLTSVPLRWPVPPSSPPG